MSITYLTTLSILEQSEGSHLSSRGFEVRQQLVETQKRFLYLVIISSRWLSLPLRCQHLSVLAFFAFCGLSTSSSYIIIVILIYATPVAASIAVIAEPVNLIKVSL